MRGRDGEGRLGRLAGRGGKQLASNKAQDFCNGPLGYSFCGTHFLPSLSATRWSWTAPNPLFLQNAAAPSSCSPRSRAVFFRVLPSVPHAVAFLLGISLLTVFLTPVALVLFCGGILARCLRRSEGATISVPKPRPWPGNVAGRQGGNARTAGTLWNTPVVGVPHL